MPIKVLTFTTLYPNSVQGRHGIFVENRLLHFLKEYEGVELKVVAPVPWFPFKWAAFGEYGKYARVPAKEIRGGVQVFHPRYPVIPKVGMSISPYLMAMAVYPSVKKLIANGFDIDVIDAHYFYPDGVAASLLARWLKKPFICTARGNDISLLPRYPVPKKLIGRTISEAEYVITVCQALADGITKLDYKPKKMITLRNGVDLVRFTPPQDREQLRSELGVVGFTIISVGHFIERKGHHLLIEALTVLPGVSLLIAGDGPMEKQLRSLVERLGLVDRVRFLGSVGHEKLKEYYGASDALVLASSREGWANVLLESMACGTPVVATAVWGTPEVVSLPSLGVLVERTVSSIAEGIKSVQGENYDRNEIRQYAESYSWDEVSHQLWQIFDEVRSESCNDTAI